MFTSVMCATMKRKGGKSSPTNRDWTEDDYMGNDSYTDRLEFGKDKAKRTKQKQKERRDKQERMWEGWDG